jgi:hypothetical protein
LDGTNVPSLRPDPKSKVIFDIAATLPMPFSLFGMTLHAFTVGNLLSVPLGHRSSEREDEHHLVIEVLPDGA